MAAGSWSRPIRRPLGPIFFKISRACPPLPRVPSITVAPDFKSRHRRTSCKRTGLCGKAPDRLFLGMKRFHQTADSDHAEGLFNLRTDVAKFDIPFALTYHSEPVD